jgi:hypothetical protein
VATQSCGGNGISGETHTLLAPETSDVYLKVQVTERGLSDAYQFFYKGQLADPWIAVGNASTYTSEGNDSRVGLVYKTRRNAAGVSFDDFAITAPVSVAENTTGTVYTAQATAEAGSTLTYTLGGTDAALFSINSDTGALAFLLAPNYEDPRDEGGDNQYDLTVTVSDGIATSAPQSVVIGVTNVVEPSAVNVTVSPARVAEGDAANLVYTFTRSDRDADGELTVNIGMGGTATAEDYASNGTLEKSWSRLDGFVTEFSPPSLPTVTFAPGSTTATLTLKATADQLTEGDETVTVTVLAGRGYDLGTTLEATGIIEDNLPPAITSANTASVAEGITDTVYTVIAEDPNVGSTLDYALDGTDADLFSISSTGAVTFKAAPNFEAPLDDDGDNVYNITVTASDGVNALATQAVAITVNDVTATVNVAVTAGLNNTPINFGLGKNGSTDGYQSVYLIPVDGFASAIGQDVLSWSFASGSFDGDRSITPLLFEKVSNDYVLRAIGSTQQAQGNTVYQDLAFNVIAGDATIANANYVFGWKDGTQTLDNAGVISIVDGSPGYWTSQDSNGQDITDTVVGEIVPFRDRFDGRNYQFSVNTGIIKDLPVVTEGDAAQLMYTFTRSGDIDGELTVDITLTGTATTSDYAPSPFNKDWSRLLGGSVTDFLRSIATTSDGGFYAVGQATDYSNDNPMTSADSVPLTHFGNADAFISKYDSLGIQQWARVYGGANDDAATSVVVGSDGSAYIAGYGNGTDGANGTFIAKYLPTGALDTTWELTDVSPSGWDNHSIILTPDESAVLILSNNNGQGSYLTKVLVEADGSPGTAASFTVPNRVATAIATTSDGLVYLTGYTQSNIDGQTLGGQADAFISQLDATGAVVWSRLIGGAADESGTSVVVGPDGAVYVAGGSYSHIFLNKFDSNGSTVWEQTIANGVGAESSNNPCSLVIGSDGFVYLSGTTTQAMGDQVSLGSNDAFISRINPSNGEMTLTHIVGSAGDDRPRAIAAGPDGEIFIGGFTFNNNGIYDNLPEGLGNVDGFVTKFSSPSLSQVTFAAGSTTATLVIEARADQLSNEGNETLTVTVEEGQGYSVGSSASATGTIENVDTTAPTVSTFSPTDAATGVVVGSNIVLTFSEAIQRGTGNIQIRSGSATGGVVETFDTATSTGLSIFNSTLTINPTSDLAYGTRHFVTFAAGSVRDLAGNNYAGTNIYDFTSVAAADGSFQFEANTRTHGFAYEIPSSELDLSSIGTQLYGSFASVDGGTPGTSSVAAVQVLTLPEGLGIVNQPWNLYPAIVFSPGETVTLAVAGEALTHTFVSDALTLEDLVAGWQADSDFDAADITLSVIDSTITITHNSVGPQAAAAVELAGVASLDGSVAPSVDQLVSIIRAAPSYPDAPFYVYADPNNSVYGGADAANKSIVLQWKQPSGGSPGFKFGEQFWPAAGPLADYPVFEHQVIDLSAIVDGSGFSAGTTLNLAIDDPGTDGQLDLTHIFTTGALTLSGLVSGWRADPDFDAAGIYLSVSGNAVKIEYERYSDPSMATVSLPGTNLSEAITLSIPYNGTGTKWSTLSTYPYLVSSITGRFEGISAEGGIEIEPGRFEDQVIYNTPQWDAALYSATVKLGLPTLTDEVWTITEFDGAVTDVDADGDLDVSDLKAALEAAEGFNTAGVALSVIDDDLVVTYEYYANVPDVAALDLTTVANSIDLGAIGQLIAPVQVEGKWYYHLDRNEDGTIAGDAYTLSDANTYPLSEIYELFKQDVNGVAGSSTNDTYRYATVNGVKLALPTLGTSATEGLMDGTALADPSQTNPSYDDLSAIWDAYNGTLVGSYAGQDLDGSNRGSGNITSGAPSTWVNGSFVTATPWPSSTDHAALRVYDGLVFNHANWPVNVALHVL